MYYPFAPANPKPRFPKNVAYMALECDRNGKFSASAIIFEWTIYQFTTPEETVEFIHALPPAAWLITYQLNYISCLFEPLINTFDHIDGYERNPMLLNLTAEGATCYIVDIEQYFSSLWDAAHKIGIKGNYNDNNAYKQAIIIFTVWRTLERVVYNCLGVSLSRTPGATAMKSLKRYLPEPIFARGRSITKYAYTTIKAPALHWDVGYYPEAYLYDINASYPHVMKVLRYPTVVRTFANHPPQYDRWIATVKLNYRTRNKFSPLQVTTAEGEVIRPSEASNYRTTITYLDYLTLGMCGDIEIIEWIEGITWSANNEADLFSTWVNNIEQHSYTEPEHSYLKVISRALHSKFAQKSGYKVEIITVDNKAFRRLKEYITEWWLLSSGDLAVKVKRKIKPMFYPHLRPEWEALTLSMARYMIYSTIDLNTIYVDTDCIISTKERADLYISSNFGAWKLQEHGPCYIAGPRSYTIGVKSKLSGLHGNRNELSEAIKSAVKGLPSTIKSNTASGILGDMIANNSSFTIKSANYPKAIVKGSMAWVTRSPTIKTKLKSTVRVISIPLTDD